MSDKEFNPTEFLPLISALPEGSSIAVTQHNLPKVAAELKARFLKDSEQLNTPKHIVLMAACNSFAEAMGEATHRVIHEVFAEVMKGHVDLNDAEAVKAFDKMVEEELNANTLETPPNATVH